MNLSASPSDVMGAELRPLFATPFLVTQIEGAQAINEALRPVILDRRDRFPSARRSNDGGWQSDLDFEAWGGAAGARILAAARTLADGLTQVQTEAGLVGLPPVWTMNAWANVNGPGDANMPHHHPAAFWSGVYWLEAGEAAEPGGDCGGELEFMDPRGVLPAFYAPTLRYAISGCLSAGRSEFFTPRTGTLVLFPAWLVHSVRRYTGAGVRISVAFNLSI